MSERLASFESHMTETQLAAAEIKFRKMLGDGRGHIGCLFAINQNRAGLDQSARFTPGGSQTAAHQDVNEAE